MYTKYHNDKGRNKCLRVNSKANNTAAVSTCLVVVVVAAAAAAAALIDDDDDDGANHKCARDDIQIPSSMPLY